MTSTAVSSAVIVPVAMGADLFGFLTTRSLDAPIQAAVGSARTVNKGRGVSRVLDLAPAAATTLEQLLLAESRKLLAADKIAPADRKIARFAKQVADRIPAQIEKAAAKATKAPAAPAPAAPAKPKAKTTAKRQPATVAAAAADAKAGTSKKAAATPVSDQLLANFAKAGLPVKRTTKSNERAIAKAKADPKRSAAAKKAAATRAANRAKKAAGAGPDESTTKIVNRVLSGETSVEQEILRILA